jgi:hypothetical protein
MALPASFFAEMQEINFPALTLAAPISPALRFHSFMLITTNDDWQDNNLLEIAATGLAPADERESAILATLNPANYTAIVRGKDGTTGWVWLKLTFFP